MKYCYDRLNLKKMKTTANNIKNIKIKKKHKK